jgi:hypothetical protein
MKEQSILKYLDSHLLDCHYTNYINKMMESVKHKGKATTVKLYKDLFLISQCVATGRPFEPLKFIKSDSRGIPRILSPLLYLLESDSVNLKRYALTITRQYTCIYLEPVFNPSPIIDEALNTIPEVHMESFSNWVRSTVFLPKCPSESMLFSPFDLNLSTSAGPNGPAMLTSHIDALALENNPEILYWFEKLNILTNTS